MSEGTCCPDQMDSPGTPPGGGREAWDSPLCAIATAAQIRQPLRRTPERCSSESQGWSAEGKLPSVSVPVASGWPRGGLRVASSVLSLSTTETFGSVRVCGLPTACGSECHSLLVLQVLPLVRPRHNPELPNWDSVLFCWHLSQEPRHVLASQEERGLCVRRPQGGKGPGS